MSHRPRTKPYTEIGIKRLKCTRCGDPAEEQWKACADGQWRPVCVPCDVDLNELVLTFMAIPLMERVVKMRVYRIKRGVL